MDSVDVVKHGKNPFLLHSYVFSFSSAQNGKKRGLWYLLGVSSYKLQKRRNGETRHTFSKGHMQKQPWHCLIIFFFEILGDKNL